MSFVARPMKMAANIRCRYDSSKPPARSIAARISAFLSGTSDGEDLLHALYDHVLHEPMPASMRALLSAEQAQAAGD